MSIDSLSQSSTPLVVVAIDSRNLVALATTHLVKHIPTSLPSGESAKKNKKKKHIHTLTPSPPLPHTGPVQVNIQGASPPDPLGRVRLHFGISRADAQCRCRAGNNTRVNCTSGVFDLDPVILGAGTHSILIVCMDPSGSTAERSLKVILPRPPPPSEFSKKKKKLKN